MSDLADQWQTRVLQAYAFLELIDSWPLREMIEASNRGDTIAAAVDPTLWIKKSGAAADDRRALEILCDAQAAWRRFKESKK